VSSSLIACSNYLTLLLNLKMLSPESEHFEEHIIVKILHTFRGINVPICFFGHTILQRLDAEYAPDYAKEFSPTNRARAASLPQKKNTLHWFPMKDLSRALH
jgi:hypothetical protein